MTKKTSKQKYYPPIHFDIESYPGCCGISVVESIDDDYEDNYASEKDSYYPFESKEKQHVDFYKQLLDQRHRSFLQMSLVSRYSGAKKKKDGTYAGQNNPLLKFLINEKKWKVLQVFKNSNTNNEVTVIGKTFPPKKKREPSVAYYW